MFELIDQKPQGKKCAAIEGILEEGQEIIKEYKGSPALDAGLVSSAQAVEHYEIARYGTLRTWAEELGLGDAAKLLQETLDEEEATDQALTEICRVGGQPGGAVRGGVSYALRVLSKASRPEGIPAARLFIGPVRLTWACMGRPC